MKLEELLKYKHLATERQLEYLETWDEFGSQEKACEHLGTSKRKLQEAMARLRATIKAESLKNMEEDIEPHEEHKLKRQNRDLQAENNKLKETISQDKDIAALYSYIKETPIKPPKWLTKSPKKGKKAPAIATAMLSDTHFDEIVHPDQINGVNAYSRDIATERLNRFFEKVVMLQRDYMTGFDIEGIVLALGGDMVSGIIHQELVESNETMIMDTVVYWVNQLIGGIEMLSKEFPNVYVPCVVGNHGRLTRKPRAKFRAQDNFDYLIYQWLKHHFELQKINVKVEVASGPDIQWKVYNTTYHMTHGDQFRGGQGWGGIYSPIMRGDDKKRRREEIINTPYDILIMGHFHQIKDMGTVIINGSLKGYDEYAYTENFAFEHPQQAFWLTDPDHGKINFWPIFVASEDDYSRFNDLQKSQEIHTLG